MGFDIRNFDSLFKKNIVTPFLYEGGYIKANGLSVSPKLVLKNDTIIEEYLDKIELFENIHPLGLFENIASSVVISYALFNKVMLVGVYPIIISRSDYLDVSEIRIDIMGSITKDELIQSIEKNWKCISEIRDDIIKKESRIKISKEITRDIEIYNLYIDLLKDPSQYSLEKYVDIKIRSKFLEKGLKIDEGTIRSIISRMKKDIDVANKVAPLY